MSEALKIWHNNEDFVGIVPKWSSAIKDSDVEPFLREVQSTFKLLIPAALYSVLNTVATAKYKAWTRTKTYSIGNRILWEQRLYASLTSHSASQPPNATNWNELEIWSVYRDFIKPYILYQAASKYVVWADKWMVQEGSRRVMTQVNEPLTAEEVAQMGNSLQSTADKYFLAYERYMDENDYTIDDVEYKATSAEDIREFKTNARIRIV